MPLSRNDPLLLSKKTTAWKGKMPVEYEATATFKSL
jgi:DNA-binding GntR family transcriptional regulator